MAGVDLGASIACSGVCLTVVDKGDGWFAVDVSAETLSRTAPGMWEAGRRLNLERALKVGDELGGHIVTGHVDAVGRIVRSEEHTSELQSLMRISYAVFCLKKKTTMKSKTLTSIHKRPDTDH